VEIYGYAPGGVPPLAHRTSNLPMYLDDSLRRYDQLYAAGGAHNAIFPITREQLVAITGARFADVKRDNSQPDAFPHPLPKPPEDIEQP
jgi:prolyl-tRNA editing enzyme YbaK/EbsC (Cys-tRNA(Pro) deacylase)